MLRSGIFASYPNRSTMASRSVVDEREHLSPTERTCLMPQAGTHRFIKSKDDGVVHDIGHIGPKKFRCRSLPHERAHSKTS
jgi:hypothetical protein